MAPRPAKRQRRSTIVASDDSDDDWEIPSSKASKHGTQREITLDARTSQTVSPAKAGKGKPAPRKSTATPKPSPKSSPEKARKNTRQKSGLDQSKSLHNFFTKASDDQRWRKRSDTPELAIEDGEIDDAIEDDDLSDDTLQQIGLQTDTLSAALDRRKPPVSANGSFKLGGNEAALPSSQRFVKAIASTRSVTNHADEDQTLVQGHRPWADRYGPSNLEELVVHKKKVADVQNWLQGKLDGRNHQRLLILKGPAGSGKTTTLSLLSQAMGLQLVSWRNPDVSEVGANNSTAVQFDEFLNRGGQFGSLAFEHDSAVRNLSKGDQGHRVLVVEEFPASITRFSSTSQSFRSVILQFLARNKTASPAILGGQQNGNENAPPVVIIISETLLSSSTALADSFTAHRLLGPQILNHPFATVMDFNPVATTFLTKALDLVMKKEARDSRRRRIPGPAVVQTLAEMGDVRSAVNSLEFLCLRGGDGSEWSGTVAALPKRTSKDKDTATLTEMERNSLQMVSQRETTLDMFHAAGRIVYNKREDPRVLDTRAEPPPKPPDHLMHLYTPKASQVDIEVLLNETGTDIQTFISTLHENYVLSCNGDRFEESFAGCSEILSTSDVLNPDSRPSRRANTNPNATMIQASLQAGSSDTLRQDEISFHVATRGLLFNLPYPVNRANLPSGKKGDTFKMFYPASLRLWKPTEEMDSLIEMFVNGDGVGQDGSSAGAGHRLQAADVDVDGGVATWRTRTFMTSSSGPAIKVEPGATSDDGDDDGTPLPRPLHRSKAALTLEILPFMARIESARNNGETSTSDTLARITRFKPSGFLSLGTTEDDALDEQEGDNANATTERTSSLAGSRLADVGRSTLTKQGQIHGATAAATAAVSALVQTAGVGVDKLYISDDDIEDE